MRKPISCVLSLKGLPRIASIPIEQQMTTIEHRDREEIDQPDTHRNDGGEIEQSEESRRRHLPRHLRDSDGPAKLVGGFAASNHVIEIAERAGDHEVAFLDRHDEGGQRIVPLQGPVIG